MEELKGSPEAVVRSAAGKVRDLLSARLSVHLEALGGGESGTTEWRGQDAGETGGSPVPLAESVVTHPFWIDCIESEGPRHASFLQDASVEFRRLGLPAAADAYLTTFLLESVDEIDMLAALAVDGSPRMGDFPPEVTGSDPPVTQDPTLYAAWLHRQTTLRMLRRMGVPADDRFAHVFLDAGLGQMLTPYSWRMPR